MVRRNDENMYGKRLKELRREKGWTIEEAARKIYVSRSTWAGYETEHRKPPIPTLIRLSKLFDVSVDYLLGITNERNILRLECDLSLYLQKEDLHWNGVPLNKVELKAIQDVLKLIAESKAKQIAGNKV